MWATSPATMRVMAFGMGGIGAPPRQHRKPVWRPTSGRASTHRSDTAPYAPTLDASTRDGFPLSAITAFIELRLLECKHTGKVARTPNRGFVKAKNPAGASFGARSQARRPLWRCHSVPQPRSVRPRLARPPALRADSALPATSAFAPPPSSSSRQLLRLRPNCRRQTGRGGFGSTAVLPGGLGSIAAPATAATSGFGGGGHTPPPPPSPSALPTLPSA